MSIKWNYKLQELEEHIVMDISHIWTSPGPMESV